MAINFNVKFATNVDELKRQLKEGVGEIVTTQSAMDRLVASIGGEKVIRAAHNYAAALKEIGGEAGALSTIEKLTSQERQRGIALLDKAIAKYELLGKEAPQALRDILAETKKVATANGELQLDKPIGGIEKSLGSLKSGLAGVAAAAGIGFGVGAVVSFGKSIFADADALVKLSDKTGVTIDWLERFQVAGDDAGNSLDDITSAITKMEDKLVSGDASAVGALSKLHLSLADLKGLKPEDQFVKISDALREVKDPAEQVNIAIDLFGKTGANVLPTLKRGFDDLKNAAVGMGDETARALDKAGDKLDEWWRKFKGISAQLIVGAVEAPGKIGFGIDEDKLFEDARRQRKLLEELGKDGSFKQFATLGSTLPSIGGTGADNVLALAAAFEKLHPAADELKRINAELERQQRIQSEQSRLSGADAAQKLSELVAAWGHLSDTQKGNSLVVGRLLQDYEPLRKALGPGQLPADIEALAVAQDHAEAESKRLTAAVRGLEGGLKDLDTATLPVFINIRKMADEMAAVRKQVDAIELDPEPFKGASRISGPIPGLPLIKPEEFVGPMKHTFGMAVQATAKEFPATLIAAFTGGGSFKGAAQAIGTDFSTKLFGKDGTFVKTSEKLAGAFGESGFGKALGGSLAAALPGIGALIGPAITGLGKIFGKLFGSEGRKTNDLRDAFQASFGKNGVGGTLDDLVKGFGRVGLGIDKVQKLLHAGNEKDFKRIVDEFNAATATQKTAFDKLNTAVEKYGFSISELGPEFRAQKLGESAASLFEDFELLKASGIDTATILKRMSGIVISTAEDGTQAVTDWGNGFGKLIHDAITTGTALPKELEPIVKQMIELGLITRDDGTKFGSLEDAGVTFAGSLADVIKDDLIPTLKDLAIAIKQGLHIPLSEADQAYLDLKNHIEHNPIVVPPVTVTVTYDTTTTTGGPPPGFDPNAGGYQGGMPGSEDNPNRVWTGGLVTNSGIQHFARGGRVLPFPRFGTDTVPAMLTPGELVLNDSQQHAIGTLLAKVDYQPQAMVDASELRKTGTEGGGRGGDTYYITNHINGIDGPSIKRVVQTQEFADAIALQGQRQKYGLNRKLARSVK